MRKLLVFAFLVNVSATQAADAHLIVTPTDKGSSRQICSGTISEMSAIEATNISVEGLKRGVPCAVGDLDGNGSKDYALLHPMKRNCQNCGDSFHAFVLMMEGTKIWHTAPARIMLDKNRGERGFFAIEATRGDSRMRYFGCKTPRTEFLFENGEGGTSYVVSYDKVTKQFKVTSTCASEDN